MNQLSVIAHAASSTQSAGSRGTSSASDSASSSEETRAFLQRRVAAVGRVLSGIFGTFLTYRLIATLFEPNVYGPDVDVWGAVPYLALSTLSFFALWLSLRGKPRSLCTIRRIEIGCFFVGTTTIQLMPFHVPYTVRPDYIVIMALAMVYLARAVFVPSTAQRTLAMGAAAAVPLLVIVYLVHLHGHDPAHYSAAAPAIVRESAATWAMRWTSVALLWWASFVGLAGATSYVIYGLRKEVRDARKLGQYTLEEKLGEGGMGAVYRASHAMLRRPTAVKLLPPDRFGEQSLARFEREVQLTAALSHPNTVRVFDYGRTPDGVFYYAMEYLDGANLAEIVDAGGAMPAARVIHVLDHLVGALAEAHGIGLIHRDIKPANVLLTEQGGIADFVKVVDFGLVKDLGRADGLDLTAPQLTQANSVAGTPHYMAPEAISAPDQIDARADLYAVGAVGYFLLTGREVFTGRNSFELFGHHLHSRPTPPSERLGAPVPDELERLILCCLEKEPTGRPADARALQTSLRRLRDANEWTEDDARQWWTEFGPTVRTRRKRGAVSTGTTMAVDLEMRALG